MTTPNPRLVVLTENKLLEGICGSLQPIREEPCGIASDYRKDSKRPQIWYRRDGTATYLERDVLDGSITGLFATSSSYQSLSVQIDQVTGDVYALEQTGDGSQIIVYPRGSSGTSVVTFDAILSMATDMKLDPFRRVLWVADSCNHRVLKIDMGLWQVLMHYADASYILPCSLVIDPNTGDAFVRWYLAGSQQEVISRLSSSGINESYFTTGDFFGEVDDSCLPLDSPGSQSMAYDAARSRLWWVSNSYCKRVGMIDVLQSSGRNLTIYCEQSSSSSVSSSSPSSVSSSSLSSTSSSNSSSSSSVSSSSSSSISSSSSSSISSSSVSSVSSRSSLSSQSPSSQSSISSQSSSSMSSNSSESSSSSSSKSSESSSSSSSSKSSESSSSSSSWSSESSSSSSSTVPLEGHCTDCGAALNPESYSLSWGSINFNTNCYDEGLISGDYYSYQYNFFSSSATARVYQTSSCVYSGQLRVVGSEISSFTEYKGTNRDCNNDPQYNQGDIEAQVTLDLSAGSLTISISSMANLADGSNSIGTSIFSKTFTVSDCRNLPTITNTITTASSKRPIYGGSVVFSII